MKLFAVVAALVAVTQVVDARLVQKPKKGLTKGGKERRDISHYMDGKAKKCAAAAESESDDSQDDSKAPPAKQPKKKALVQRPKNITKGNKERRDISHYMDAKAKKCDAAAASESDDSQDDSKAPPAKQPKKKALAQRPKNITKGKKEQRDISHYMNEKRKKCDAAQESSEDS